MTSKIAVVACLNLFGLLLVESCEKSQPPTQPVQTVVDPRAVQSAQAAAEQKAAGEALAKLEQDHFAGVDDARKVIDLYRKKFSGWRKVSGEACALWSALKAVDQGALTAKPLRDAVLLQVNDEITAHRPPEMDSAADNFAVRTAIEAAVVREDSFQCDRDDVSAKDAISGDPRMQQLQQVADERGLDIGRASDAVRDKVFFHELLSNRVQAVMKAHAPALVKRAREQERSKHPYVLACETRFLKAAAPEESYAVDGPLGEDSESKVTDALLVDVAERAARIPGAAAGEGRRNAPRPLLELPPPLKRFAEVCDSRLNAAWGSPRPTTPAGTSTVIWQEVSNGGSARTEGLWHARALVRLSDKLSAPAPDATPWMLVIGVGFKGRWRLAAFPVAPDRFPSFVGRVTVAKESNVWASYGTKTGKPGMWRAHARGVQLTCQPAPKDVYADDGACQSVDPAREP